MCMLEVRTIGRMKVEVGREEERKEMREQCNAGIAV